MSAVLILAKTFYFFLFGLYIKCLSKEIRENSLDLCEGCVAEAENNPLLGIVEVSLRSASTGALETGLQPLLLD